jgi:hypothetical protein
MILSGLRFELRSLAGYYLGIPTFIGMRLDQAREVPGAIEQLRNDAEEFTRQIVRLQETLDAACATPAATPVPSSHETRAAREVLRAARCEITGLIDRLTQIRAGGENLVAQRVLGLDEEFPLAIHRTRELLDRLVTLRDSIPDPIAGDALAVRHLRGPRWLLP